MSSDNQRTVPTEMATNATKNPHPATEPLISAELAPAGFGSLSRRITGWTSNLVATAVILVGGLVVGRQVLEWWRVEANSPGNAASSAVEAAGILPNVDEQQRLEFGASPHAIRREEIRGDRSAATAALGRRCRELATTASAPAGTISATERRLLDRLATAQPAADSTAQLQFFEMEDALPMIVGVRAIQAETNSTEARLAAANDRRVVAWGVAFPTSDESWVLFLLEPGAADAARGAASSPIPLPPGSRHVMSLGDESGGTLTTFKGAARADDWIRFFRDSLAKQGWNATADWHSSANVWHARYRNDAAHHNGGAGRRALDLQLADDGRGELVGLVSLSAATSQAKSETKEK